MIDRPDRLRNAEEDGDRNTRSEEITFTYWCFSQQPPPLPKHCHTNPIHKPPKVHGTVTCSPMPGDKAAGLLKRTAILVVVQKTPKLRKLCPNTWHVYAARRERKIKDSLETFFKFLTGCHVTVSQPAAHTEHTWMPRKWFSSTSFPLNWLFCDLDRTKHRGRYRKSVRYTMQKHQTI